MPSTDKLAKKHVIFKTREPKPCVGTVYSTEPLGIWVQVSSGLPDAAGKTKFPALFVPYVQLEWLVTALEPSEVVGH